MHTDPIQTEATETRQIQTQTLVHIDSLDSLTQCLHNHNAVLLIFGAPHCGVCQALKPLLANMLHNDFPHMVMAYIDCQAHPDIAAMHHVFSLPVVACYFQGQAFGRFSKVFSLADVKAAIMRPYELLNG